MKKKLFKKITALTLTRRIIQAISIVLFPGLFISTFLAIKSIYTALINGTFDASAMAGQIILAVSMLLITAVMGRFFCGFLCAFGSIGDFFWYIGTKLKLKRPTIGIRTDQNLKKVKYFLLAGVVLLTWTMGVSVVGGTSNPWTVFGMLTKFDGWTSPAALLSIGMALLLLIAAGSMYFERFFCRYLCPLGAVFAIVSRFRLFQIRKPRQDCGVCRACTKSCSMGIPLYRTSVVTSAECIDCMSCVEICPRDNVKANPKPAIAAAVAVVSLSGMYYAGNLARSKVVQQNASAVSVSVSSKSSASSGPFLDGAYSGNSAGYHGKTRAAVTVSGGYIVSIDIQSTDDDLEFFNLAEAAIVPDIIEAQSVAVDVVSGATFSSNAIIGAVKDALTGALSMPSDVVVIEMDRSALPSDPVLTPPPVPTPAPSTTPETANDGPISLADGVYTGSGRGYRGTITVEVTIENGYIAAIKIVSYSDDESYFRNARSKILNRIIDAQSIAVDTVSGATYSSNGILEAVADALRSSEEAMIVLQLTGVDTVSGATYGVGSTAGTGSTTGTSGQGSYAEHEDEHEDDDDD